MLGGSGRQRAADSDGPIPPWAKDASDEWRQAVPYKEGLLLGKVNKGGRFVGQGMTAPAIYGVVLKYEKLLKVTVKSHDLPEALRRLFIRQANS